MARTRRNSEAAGTTPAVPNNEDIYVDLMDYMDDDYPFQIFVGCRGMGKTYSGLKGLSGRARESGFKRKFIYSRRTQDQLDSITDGVDGEGMNPFKRLNADMGTDIGFHTLKKKITLISDRYREEDGSIRYAPESYGYGIAMKSVASITGLDASDCDDWFYDEFIRQRHEPSFSGEFDAIMGAYETFNRNREFDGSPAMRFWAVSNAVDIYNVLFKGLHLVHDAERMAASGKQHRYYKDRRLAIHLMQPTEAFRQMKVKTALAQLTKGTEYYDMAFNNDFAYNDFSLIKYQPLTGYRPYAALDDAYIYCKKGEERYYVCYAKCKCERFNSKLRQDVMSFQRNYGVRLVNPFRDGRIAFESYELKELILGVIL